MTELRWILLGLGALLVAAIYLYGRRQAARSALHNGESGSSRIEPTVYGADGRHGQAVSSSELDASAAESAIAETLEPKGLETGVPPRGIRREPQLGTAHAASSQSAPNNAGWAHSEEWTELPLRRQRLEPTLDDTAPKSSDIPSQGTHTSAAPSQSKAQRPTGSRKIIALRLVAPAAEHYAGRGLLEEFARLGLKHGRYGIFHRSDADGRSVFSVASMVEPGSFDLAEMPTAGYPGLTLFAVLPGPMQGAITLDSLIACARELQNALGGSLQDERGAPLNPQRVTGLQSEVAAFESLAPGGSHA